MSIKAVLFDLDGTLLDTAPDLAIAINKIRQNAELLPMAHAVIRSQVSLGGAAMIDAAFPDRKQAEKDILRKEFLQAYVENPTSLTAYFPGMQALLDTLAEQEFKIGIVTNKPRWLTQPIIDNLNLREYAETIVCGDDLAHSKPHPAPLLHACTALNVAPNMAVYIGDAQRDIEAANNAGMRSLIALFGYIRDGDDPHTWQATATIQHPDDVLKWINKQTT